MHDLLNERRLDIPRDQYKEYYSEKLWEMIPAIYRHEDGIAQNPGVLRAFIEVIAEQAALTRRSHDRLWDDQFIELCDDWAVPYIADLVGTRLVSALNKRARRVDVAKTIYYRRRKGTLRVLEELISDVAGWEGKVVENFRRLGRMRHGLDPHPGPLAGRISNTIPGGCADLRKPVVTDLIGGPFDEYHYTPDFRRHCGNRGCYSIPKLAFHLYRKYSLRIVGATPYKPTGVDGYTFDPSGRDIPLFAPRGRGGDNYDWDDWQSLREWELPGPIPCRVLAQNEAKNDLIPHAIGVSVDSNPNFGPTEVVAADLSLWSLPNVNIEVAVDPERGRFLFPQGTTGTEFSVDYHYGIGGEIGAGPYPRPHIERVTVDVHKGNGNSITVGDLQPENVIQIDDNATYTDLSNPTAGIRQMTIQAANLRRPFIRLAHPWHIDSGVSVGATSNIEPELILDGLWLGGGQEIVLKGEFEKVVLRHITLDPGGFNAIGEEIHAVPLIVEGFVENLVIEFSVIGPVTVRDGGSVEHLVIEDSIVDALNNTIPAVLALPLTKAKIDRTTVFGGLQLKTLHASTSIVTGDVELANLQTGCFRFSAALKSLEQSLPRSFMPFWIPETGSAQYFSSRRFGDPDYGQLSDVAPIQLRTGAENGSEIGAFSRFLNPIRLESLNTKIEEYMPFGQVPIYISST